MLRVKGVIILAIVIMAATAFFVYKFSLGQLSGPDLDQPLTSLIKPSASPMPSSSPQIKNTTASQVSPDGKITLIMKTKSTAPDLATYSLYVETQGSDEAKLIFSQDLTENASLELPFNSWSPDNKQFFIKQHNQNQDQFLVFRASGESFSDEEKFLDVNQYFIDKEIPGQFTEATGWAAPYLLIVRTFNQEENRDGPAFWFDTSTQRFIRLSTAF